MLRGWALLLLGLQTLGAPAPNPPVSSPPSVFELNLPPGFPEPLVPPGEEMSAAKVELGRHLFYDPRLSATGAYACASCHRQELAFTDGLPRAVGATGELHPRSAMSLANVAYNGTFGWDDPHLDRLGNQALVPMLNRHPVELGLAGHEEEVLERFRRDPRYALLVAAAFPDLEKPLDLDQVALALAAFERTLISGDSPFDRWLYRDEPLPEDARRGMRLFFSERLGCSGCHRGFNFSDQGFHNTGLYNVDSLGAYPAENTGLHRFTGRPEDMGRFRAPTLRNIALTAPYMHDGSLASLAEVLDHYALGGRAASALTSPRLRGFELSETQKADLLAFLDSLTDRGFVEDPRFSDPFMPTHCIAERVR